MEIYIAGLSAIIAVLGAGISMWQARIARRSLKQAALIRLFSTFDAASEVTIGRPTLLYEVHGLDRSIPEEEASNIAYLSFLLDGFQHYYGEETSGDFAAMARRLKSESTFLNKILSVPANQVRWESIKSLYYGDFDRDYIKAIEELIEHEKAKNTDKQ
jgi:hypothetical protein